MYKIEEIENDRDQKLKTLLLDHVDQEVEFLKNELMAIKDKIQINTVLEALKFTLAQDYGSHELARYYVTHPLRVTRFLINWMVRYNKFNTEAVVASLIHNVIEKQVLTDLQIETQYGAWCSHTILVLTQDRVAMKDNLKRAHYYENIYSLDAFGQLLKFFDKLDNLYAICLNSDFNVRKSYIDEIVQYVRPIAITYDPQIVAYFDELIISTRNKGYYRPSF